MMVTYLENGFVEVTVSENGVERTYRTNSPTHPHPLLSPEEGETLRTYSRESARIQDSLSQALAIEKREAEKAERELWLKTREEEKATRRAREKVSRALRAELQTVLTAIKKDFESRGMLREDFASTSVKVFGGLTQKDVQAAYDRGASEERSWANYNEPGY